jgi:phage gp45-like
MSVNYQLIHEVKEWAKGFIEKAIASGIVKYGLYSRSTASGEGDAIRGYETEGSDEQPYDFAGRRVFPFGIRSLPPSGTWGVWIGKGGRSGDGVIVGAESSRFGPGNLQDGEVAIYNKVNGCVIKLDQNGAVSINAASGQTVNINGTTYSLPQWDTFMTAFAAFLNTLKSVTNATASVVATAATTMDTARTGASGWKSTAAKNG